MFIVGKSKLDENIYDKMEKGAQAIELHLDQDFINTKNYWNEAIVKGVPIAAVHTPIIDGVDLPIENRDIQMTRHLLTRFGAPIEVGDCEFHFTIC